MIAFFISLHSSSVESVVASQFLDPLSYPELMLTPFAWSLVFFSLVFVWVSSELWFSPASQKHRGPFGYAKVSLAVTSKLVSHMVWILPPNTQGSWVNYISSIWHIYPE